jgi:hypothetical protein
MRAAAAVLLALAVGAASVRGEDSGQTPVLLGKPQVTTGKGQFLVAVTGQARLPDGTRLRISLVPVGSNDMAGTPLQSNLAEVKNGAFSASPMRVKPEDVKALAYRIEASLDRTQPSHLRRALARVRRLRPATIPVSLESWQDRCKKLTRVAKELLDRMAGLLKLRDPLLVMAQRTLKKELSAAEWKSWQGRAALARAEARCLELLKAPVCQSSFPRACGKGMYLVHVFSGITNAITQTVVERPEEVYPGNEELLAVSRMQTPPNYLLDFQQVLAREGAHQFTLLLERTLGGVNPASPSKRPVAETEKDIRFLYDQYETFYKLPWPPEVLGTRAAVVDIFEETTRLIEATKSTAPDATTQRMVVWNRLQQKLGQLRANLQ